MADQGSDEVIRFRRFGRDVAMAIPSAEDHIQRTIRNTRDFYEPDVLHDMHRRVAAGDVVIDVGANIGNHTLFLALICGAQVVSVEPVPVAREILTRNLELNGVADRVRVVAAAAGARQGRAALGAVDVRNLGATRVALGEAGDLSVVAVDDLDLGGGRLALIKVDVEGGELAVLEGARHVIEEHHPLLYIEAATQTALAEIEHVLRPLGYEPVQRFGYTPMYLFIPTAHVDYGAELLQATAREAWAAPERVRSAVSGAIQQLTSGSGGGGAPSGGWLAEAQLRRAREEIAEIRSSTSFRLGHALVMSVRKPKQGLRELAVLAVRTLRRRTGRSTRPPQSRSAEPLVTVVVTTFNSRDYVERSLRSLLEQSYTNLEIIVVDDCSEDGTFDAVDGGIGQSDPRIRMVKGLVNRGTYWSKNLALVHARGEFVTFQDSDDVSSPDRIERQLSALLNAPSAVAATCNYRRVDADGAPVRNRGAMERKAIMVPLISRKALREALGYFDSVRVGADEELYRRLRVVFGASSVVHVDQPLYDALSRPGSLTQEAGSSVRLDRGPSRAGRLGHLVGPRREYAEAFRRHHQEIAANRASSYYEFPMRTRPFPAPDEILSAGAEPSHARAVSAGVASIPGRSAWLERVVETILPQVDHLYVFLNGYPAVPQYLAHERITVATSDEHGDQSDNGKFFFVDAAPSGYFLSIDDDIAYPPDYVQRLLLKLDQYEHRVVVGVHGVMLAEPMARFYADRAVLDFRQSLESDRFVNLLGTGTLAFHKDTLPLTPSDFDAPGMADLWFAIAAQKAEVPLVAVARSDGWLHPLGFDDDALYARHSRADELQTKIAKDAGPWGPEAAARLAAPLARSLLRRFSASELGTREFDVEFLEYAANQGERSPLGVDVP